MYCGSVPSRRGSPVQSSCLYPSTFLGWSLSEHNSRRMFNVRPPKLLPPRTCCKTDVFHGVFQRVRDSRGKISTLLFTFGPKNKSVGRILHSIRRISSIYNSHHFICRKSVSLYSKTILILRPNRVIKYESLLVARRTFTCIYPRSFCDLTKSLVPLFRMTVSESDSLPFKIW